MKLLMLTALLSNFYPCSYNKTYSGAIQGKLVSSQISTEAITVLLLRYPDSTLVKSALTDKSGVYTFFDVPYGSYLVSVSSITCKPSINGPYTINAENPSLIIPEITLELAQRDLKEVIVQDKRPFIEKKVGKIVLNVEKSVLAAGKNAFEIIERAPGIQIGTNESILMKGKQGVLIMIDGKPTYLSESDAANLLRNTQSDAIEQIELITNPPAKYDAAGGAGIINIKLKKGKNLGTNGSFTAGSGYGHYYNGNTGLGLNHRTKNYNLFGNLNYANTKHPETIDLDRIVDYQNHVTQFNVFNLDTKTRNSYAYKAGMDYFLTPRHTLGFLFSGFYNTLYSDESNQTLIHNNEVLDSTIMTFSDEHRYINSNSYNLNYKGNLDTAGTELTVDLDYFNYNRKSKELLSSLFYNNTAKLYYQDPLYLQNSTPSAITIRSARADYSSRLSKISTLTFGLKTSEVKSANDRLFEKLVNNQWQNDPGNSNQFNYLERIYAGYTSYTGKFKNTELELGLRAEQTHSEGNSLTTGSAVKRSYLNFFPNLQWTQTLSKNHKLIFSYSRRINRPVYEDINPFRYFMDQYNFHEGNLELKPEYSNSYEITHLLNEKYSTSIRYNYIRDVILPFREQNDATMVTIASKKNLNSQKKHRARI